MYLKKNNQIGFNGNNKGMISFFILGILVVMEVAGLAMLTTQSASLNDTQAGFARGQAKFMAQSALQEAKYYVKTVSPGWTGTRGEQTMKSDGISVGSYEYNVAAVGNTYTISATGYVPNKAAKNAISQILTTSFSYPVAVNPGIIVLDPAAASALEIQGSVALTVYGGKVLVNSNSATALKCTGNAYSGLAPEFDLVSAANPCDKLSGTVKTSSPVALDPLAYLAAPSKVGMVSQSVVQYKGGNPAIMKPGIYKGGVSLGNNTTVTMDPGIYYMDGGGFQVSGTAALTGNGVFIYNAPAVATDQIKLKGGGNVTLTAMTSGPYAGITLWQDRNSSAAVDLTGNGSLTVSGAIYVPGAKLSIGGNGSAQNVGSLDVCKTLDVSGNAKLTVNDY